MCVMSRPQVSHSIASRLPCWYQLLNTMAIKEFWVTALVSGPVRVLSRSGCYLEVALPYHCAPEYIVHLSICLKIYIIYLKSVQSIYMSENIYYISKNHTVHLYVWKYILHIWKVYSPSICLKIYIMYLKSVQSIYMSENIYYVSEKYTVHLYVWKYKYYISEKRTVHLYASVPFLTLPLLSLSCPWDGGLKQLNFSDLWVLILHLHGCLMSTTFICSGHWAFNWTSAPKLLLRV